MGSTGGGSQGVTEVRVHGVGGTPPEMILQDPHLVQISGDNLVGFYRPASDDRAGPRHREACAWGKITAGSVSTALWMLLLPFALANLAGWTHPPVPMEADSDRRTAERTVKTLVRLFSLSITVGFVLMLSNIVLDLVVYQCGGSSQCYGRRWWLAYFRWDALQLYPARRIALGGGLCLIGVMMVAWASRSSFQTLESYDPGARGSRDAGEDANQHPPDVGLAHPDFWRGAGPVGRVRDLHMSGAFAALASVTALAATSFAVGAAQALGRALVVTGLVLVAMSAVATTWPEIYSRPVDATPKRFIWLKRVSLGLLLLTLIYGASTTGAVPDGRRPRLAQLDLPIHSYFVIQAVLLLVLFGVHVAQRARSKEASESAFHGFGAFSVLAMALFAISSVWAGGLIRIADFLGRPVAEEGEMLSEACFTGEPRVVDGQALLCFANYHRKTAIVSLVVIAALAVLGLRVWLWLRRHSKHNRAEVEMDIERSGWKVPKPISEFVQKRLDSVARSYGFSQLVLDSDSLLLRVVLFGSAVALFQHFLLPVSDQFGLPLRAWVGHLSGGITGKATLVACLLALGAAMMISLRGGPTMPFYLVVTLTLAVAFMSLTFLTHRALVTGSSWAVTLLPLALSAGLYAGLRNPERRRSTGVIWDVITFWPRHYHPFAPPCYGERLIPQLESRLEHLVGDGTGGASGRVLISAHSQGSVIAVATLMQVEPESRRRMALLTYGSPLDILYKRTFPAYFGAGMTSSVVSTLSREVEWPWQHFYCRTDPLGIRLNELGPDDSTPLPGEDLETRPPAARPNTQLFDPYPWQGFKGEPPLPIRGHSAYLGHPQFNERVEMVVQELMDSAARERSHRLA